MVDASSSHSGGPMAVLPTLRKDTGTTSATLAISG